MRVEYDETKKTVKITRTVTGQQFDDYYDHVRNFSYEASGGKFKVVFESDKTFKNGQWKTERPIVKSLMADEVTVILPGNEDKPEEILLFGIPPT